MDRKQLRYRQAFQRTILALGYDPQGNRTLG